MECPRNVLEETHKFCRDLRIQKTNKYRIRHYTEKVKHSLALLFSAPAVLMGSFWCCTEGNVHETK
jgi:hypothetical protein